MGDIVCDASGLQFVDPVGLCLLAAACHQLAKVGKKLSLENVPAAIVGYGKLRKAQGQTTVS